MNDLQLALVASSTSMINFDESYQKLVKAASRKEYQVVDNEGGGSCQFLAVSQQLEHHLGVVLAEATLRKKVVQHLRENPFTVSMLSAENQ